MLQQITLEPKSSKFLREIDRIRFRFLDLNSVHPTQIEMSDATLKTLITDWIKEYGSPPRDIYGIKLLRNESLAYGEFLPSEQPLIEPQTTLKKATIRQLDKLIPAEPISVSDLQTNAVANDIQNGEFETLIVEMKEKGLIYELDNHVHRV